MDFGPGATGRLVGSEIHGFHSMQDLDVRNIMEDSRSRWLRPNEIHAMLCNYKYFTINVKPVHLPKSGTIVLFDRKMLRNFRKDGHNWKKKNDGKTVKEAHEHLKVGNEERIHVYYAHGQDNPTFVRRCYWLLDKALEHIVLVHYRETQELQASPVAPVNSNPSSVTDQSAPWLLSEDLDSGAACAHYGGMEELIVSTGPVACLTATNHEMRIHEINTLEWDELVANDPNNLTVPSGDKVLHFRQDNQIPASGSLNDGSCLPAYSLTPAISPMGDFTQPIISSDTSHLSIPDSMYNFQTTGIQVNSNMPWKDSNAYCTGDSLDVTVNDGLHSQDSFGRWMNHIIADSPGSVDTALESSISSANGSFTSTVDQHQSSVPEQIFTITDFSPAWGFSTETTKILVTGYFHYQYAHLSKSNLSCICGDACVPALIVQPGVYKCSISPHSPGLVSLCLSVDGHKPISQILNFEYRCPPMLEPVASSDDKPMWQEFQLQMRLAHLLFSTSKKLNILTSKVSPSSLKEAKRFADKTSALLNSWIYLMKSIGDDRISFAQAKDSLFELTLKQLLKEWLLERVLEGRKTTPYDSQGQGVIHLCAILGYSWAIRLFSWSGLSLDFRDKHGWTALHWAAYYGREKMVAVLLSEGAKANLVTDPTKENPGGCTASDLAAVHGFEGLAGYLSEKALVAHFEAMSIAGNASGSLQSNATEAVNSENLSEEEMNLKDTLAAYRTAADAAARIQAAFREHSLKVRTTAVEFSNPEEEARSIVAAMKIQHAFRNFESRKKMAAAVRIQYRFRTWKMRKEFLRMRNQAIKIQAAFRGLLVRRQYRKIMWSVGVLEKAVLRWRLKRRGFRGLHVEHAEPVVEPSQESDTEEDFFRTSRLQAEERVERSVVRVQAMFRSKKAQEEYRRMKLTYNQAMLEGEELRKPDMDTDR